MHVTKCRVLYDLFDERALIPDRTDDPSNTYVSPDNSSIGMTPKNIFNLFEVGGSGPGFRIWCVNIVMQEHHQAGFRCKIENPVEGLVLKARNSSRHFS